MSNGVVAPSALMAPSPSPAPTPSPSSAPAASLPPPPRPSSAGMVNQNGKRELSPDRAGPPQKTIKAAHGEDIKPVIPVAVTAPPTATPATSAATSAAPTPAPGSPSKPKEKTEEEKKAEEEKKKKDDERKRIKAQKERERKQRAKERDRKEKEERLAQEQRLAAEKNKAEDGGIKRMDSSAVAGSAGGAALLPMGRGQGFDMRAEDEAARRAVRSAVGNTKFAGNASRGRQTDLLGDRALRNRLTALGARHNMGVDDEALRYLTLAAEIRVRALLSSSVRAQQHRVTASHQHKPPLAAPRPGKSPQALWSQKITSDAHAVMQALTNANREENKAHRVARTERNARETEMARAAAQQRERDGLDGPAGSAGGADGVGPSGSGSTPTAPGSDGGDGSAVTGSGVGPSGSAGGTPARPSPREPVFQASPTFGAPPAKKTGKGKKGGAPSADVQAKMTNATALSQLGGRKRYAWETGAFQPHVPSLLSGKRKKAALAAAAAGAGGGEDGEVGADAQEGAVAAGAATRAAVDGAKASGGGAGTQHAPAEPVAPKPKRPKRTVTGPHRRAVDLDVAGDKKGRDDTALTVVDMLFALEHEGGPHGPGTVDDITRRFWTRAGGPYGRW